MTKINNFGNSSPKKWVARGAMAVALTTALLTACATEERNLSQQQRENVTAEEVAGDTDRYIGQTVTVRSEPIEKLGPSTFTIEDRQFFGGKPILVVNATGRPFTFPESGTAVQVTGEVREFVLADVEREYSLGLDANAYSNYERQPALIARSMAVAPKPGEIASDPAKYYGKPLAVTGEIDNIQGANAFTLDEDRLFGAQDLLVLRAKPSANGKVPQDGETVAVTGVLRPLVVAELEREYGFNWDTGFRRQLEVEYRGRPVFIADGVYPSAIPDSAK